MQVGYPGSPSWLVVVLTLPLPIDGNYSCPTSVDLPCQACPHGPPADFMMYAFMVVSIKPAASGAWLSQYNLSHTYLVKA